MKRAFWLLGLASVSVAAGAVSVAACSSSTAPQNPHDNLIVDTKPQPTSTTPPSSDAGVFPVTLDAALYDASSTYLNAPDGYAPLATCDKCACELAGGEAGMPTYCVGGFTGSTEPPASCDVSGSAVAVGCNAVPTACQGKSAKDTCPCILQQVKLPCFAVCHVTSTGVAVYCPNP